LNANLIQRISLMPAACSNVAFFRTGLPIMRAITFIALMSILHLPLSATADAPQRMHGLWEISVAEAGAPTRSFHICVGAGDEMFAQVDPQAGDCSPASWGRDAHYRYVAQNCSGPGGEIVRSGRFAGDFQYNYQGELRQRVVGADTDRTLEIEGRRLAPCKRLKPGEFVVKGHNGVNLNLGQ
jgi:hypothetical protein